MQALTSRKLKAHTFRNQELCKFLHQPGETKPNSKRDVKGRILRRNQILPQIVLTLSVPFMRKRCVIIATTNSVEQFAQRSVRIPRNKPIVSNDA